MNIQHTPLAADVEGGLELIGDASDEEASFPESRSAIRQKFAVKTDLPRVPVAHKYFEDEFPSPLGRYFIDEKGRRVYTNTSGYHFYFEHGDDGVYPVTMIPTKFDGVTSRRYPASPLGVSIGNGCFRRGGGGD